MTGMISFLSIATIICCQKENHEMAASYFTLPVLF